MIQQSAGARDGFTSPSDARTYVQGPYGLSYTRFRYGRLRVRPRAGTNQIASATIDVINTGARAGVAVPELYVSKPATAALAQAPRQLVGYASVSIPARRTVRVSFPLDNRAFATWATSGWTVIPGCYTLAAGSSSRSLPSHAVIARGAGCSHAAVRLSTRGSFLDPISPTTRATLLRAHRARHR